MFNLFKRRNMDSIKQACCDYAAHLGAIAAQGYHDAGEAFAGRIVFDEAKWITVHPNGKGYNNNGEKIKGTPILIDSESGAVLGGAGGKFTGKHISEMPKRGANAIQTQHDIERTRQKNADPEGFAKRQKELIAKRDQQVQAMQAAAEQKKAEAERKAKEAQEQQAKEQAAAQERAKKQTSTQKQNTLQQPPEQGATTRQSRAQEISQLVRDNPVPDQLNSYEEIDAYCRKVMPFVTTAAFQHMGLKSARGMLQGAVKMFEAFPGLIEKGLSGFTNQDALHAEFEQKDKKYKAYIKKQAKAVLKDAQKMQAIQAETDKVMAEKMERMKNNEKWKQHGGAIADLLPAKPATKGNEEDERKYKAMSKAFFDIARRRLFADEFSENEIKAMVEISSNYEKEARIKNAAIELAAQNGVAAPVEEKDQYPYYLAYFKPSEYNLQKGQKPRIWFGADFFGDDKPASASFNKAHKQGQQSGWFLPVDKDVSNETALCVHEIAHSLDFALGESKVPNSKYLSDTDPVLIKAFKDYETEMEAKGITKKNVYALTNPHEFVAEHLMEAMLNSNPSERAKLVFKQFVAAHDKFLKEKD